MIVVARIPRECLSACRLLPLALLAAACSHQNEISSAPLPLPAQADTDASAPLSAQAHLDRAVSLLQRGASVEATQELKACLATNPDSKSAKFLLAQIQTPVAELYPGDSFTIVLGRKDTLSGLAATWLGDPLAFYGLARYNGIAAAGHVVSGQRIRIPKIAAAAPPMLRTETSVAVAAPPAVSPPPPPRGAPPANLASFAAAVKAGHFIDAAHAAEAGNLTPGKIPAAMLANAYFRAAAAEKSSDAGSADVHARKAGELYLKTLRNFAQSRAAFLLALSVQGNDAAAQAGLDAATEKLAAEYFRRGLIAFQHQDLDAAIAAWDRELVLKPADHDAQLNRAQAVQLKANLQKLRG